MDNSSKMPTLSCRQCQVGRKQLKLVTLITWIGDEMITVPDFPAWVCDICGSPDYDNAAMTQLSLVLSPDAGKPINRPHASPSMTTPTDSPSAAIK